MKKTIVRQAVVLQLMELHSGGVLHLQPVEEPMPEQVEGGCDPMGSPCWSRFASRTCDCTGDPHWNSLFLKGCTLQKKLSDTALSLIIIGIIAAVFYFLTIPKFVLES